MLVTLDGQRLTDSFDPARTLGAVVEDVRHKCLGDRLIVAVALNGEALTSTALDGQLSAALCEGDQIDLESAGRVDVVQAALRDTAREVGAAADDLRAMADAINAGRTAEALEALCGLVGVWQGCQRVVVEGGALIERDLSQVMHAGRPVSEYVGELAEKLRCLRDVLDARDMVSLADLACYELPPLCETWQGVLESLATGCVAPK